MKYRNNLTDRSENAWLEVTAPFEVLLLEGHTDESNTYVGSSMMLGSVYRRATLTPGTLIQDCFGGVFAVVSGSRVSARTYLSDKHPFEKVYLPHEEVWPVDKLREVSDPGITFPLADKRPFSWKQLLRAGHHPFGRGIDFLLEETPSSEATKEDRGG